MKLKKLKKKKKKVEKSLFELKDKLYRANIKLAQIERKYWFTTLN